MRYLIIDTEAEFSEDYPSYRDVNSEHIGRVLHPDQSLEKFKEIWHAGYDRSLWVEGSLSWSDFKENL